MLRERGIALYCQKLKINNWVDGTYLFNRINLIEMRRVFIIICCLSFFVIKAQDESFTEVNNNESIVLKLNTLSKSIESIKSDFVQVKHINVLEEEIISHGDFLFIKPSNVKWSYTSPINYEVSIINGNFTINNDGNISEFDLNSNKLFGEINNMLISMVNGSILTNEMFEVLLLESKSFYKAELKPKNNEFKRFVTEIHITFDKQDMMVSKIKMKEASEDYTIIKFINKEVNSNLQVLDLRTKE